MKIYTTKSKDRTTATWSGGTTTQLAIFPKGSEFTKFDFLFRISTATVEVEEATFTFMPGTTRHLMILDGVLGINHRGRYKKNLPKFGYDVFDGEWPTTAKGCVTDFNLILREKASGKLQALMVKERGEETAEFTSRISYSALYLLSGALRMILGSEAAELTAGDFVLVDHENEAQIMHMQAVANSEIILVTVAL